MSIPSFIRRAIIRFASRARVIVTLVADHAKRTYLVNETGDEARDESRAEKTGSKWREENAQGASGAETPSRRHWHVGDGCPHCDGRDGRQSEIGQGSFRQSRGGSADGCAHPGTAQRNRAQSSNSEVGVMPRKVPDYGLVSREAKALLTKHGVSSPPINPLILAKAEGIDVKFVNFTSPWDKASGFFDPQENAIYVNKEDFPLRQTFTIAHELAHAKLHQDWVKSDEYKIFWRDEENNTQNDPYEKEANAFAARVLMPRELMNLYLHLDAATISQIFAVSVPAVKNRLAFEYGI
jgi:IrrE N-terminal-like domain